MKYQFEIKNPITHCTGCKCWDSLTTSCRFGKRPDWPNIRPADCPLVEVPDRQRIVPEGWICHPSAPVGELTEVITSSATITFDENGKAITDSDGYITIDYKTGKVLNDSEQITAGCVRQSMEERE